MLHRKGSKRKLADKIIALFPEHDCYIEPFFGTGSIFFAKPKVRYNLLNDLDDNIFNLYSQLQNNPTEFKEKLSKVVIHESCLKQKSFANHPDPVVKALHFLIDSNFSLIAGGSTLRLERTNQLSIIESQIDAVINKAHGALFACKNAVDFLNSIGSKPLKAKTNFCYADPPYLGTRGYTSSFVEQDLIDLIATLQSKDMKFAISEFNTPLVLKAAESSGLNIHVIGERRNLGGRATEVLLTNYLLPPKPIQAQQCLINQSIK